MKLSMGFPNAKQMMQRVAPAIVCTMLLLVLPGCHLLPRLRNPEPGTGPPPPSFNGITSPENSSQLGVEEFYNDRMLTCLIDQALSPIGNRELMVLNEEIHIAANEVLGRSGAYLPFLTLGAGAGLDKLSEFTIDGASLRDDTYLPGRLFTNPFGNYQGGVGFTWQLDIYRQLRNARDAARQRYLSAIDRRNFFVTRLVADISENYYGLVALDRRLDNLDLTIEIQERSLEVAKELFIAARGTDLPVQRFQAEVRKNQSQKLIVSQDIIEVENRINFLVNRYPQRVERMSSGFFEFFDMTIHSLGVGVPSELLLNRPDIRQAERDMEAAGLDVKVARVNFFPQLVLTGGVSLESFIITHLFEPQAIMGSITGGLVAPFINFRAIKAQYFTANARQLQTLYNYQRVVLEAFTQVINRLNMVENYRKSIEIKKQQLEALVKSVDIATRLFRNARADYVDVLFAQRDMMDARRDLIDIKQQQLSAVVNTYQALGGGLLHRAPPNDFVGPPTPNAAAAATPATASNDPANPGPQPVGPAPVQPRPATDIPQALP